jgi:hypothetical protein
VEENEAAPRDVLDVAHGDAAVAELIVSDLDVVDHKLHAFERPRGRIGESLAKAIEQPEPGGVSCTNRSSSLTTWS